ncbi:hypothetical protein [Methylocystis rosea]|uniref:Uncharacterized protein n=1 Tax=Methylocystis rosea TaxID=173366 RepID=A0A3G8M6Z2_9HYPH|nr:hypothetical protein [Methylocystis rosea]AZG77517.1 hypothetical protein EHO51_12685 [Methylocystis rosea]
MAARQTFPAPQLELGVLASGPDRIEALESEKGKTWSSPLKAGIKGWDEVAKQLGEHVEPVIEFLKNFTPGE